MFLEGGQLEVRTSLQPDGQTNWSKLSSMVNLMGAPAHNESPANVNQILSVVKRD